jgi:hypothetical protein
MAGRAATRYRWAASVSSAAAAITSTLPLWRGDNAFAWLIYLLVGLAVDAGPSSEHSNEATPLPPVSLPLKLKLAELLF